jgi:hypothetical protein
MSQTMTRTQIYIEPDVLAQAKLKAQTQGFNLSQYLRHLLKEDITQSNKPNMKGKEIKSFKIPGLKKGEKVNYSTNHNDIYDI